MWISPSIPSRSTKAPKSTMLEILPSTTSPGWRRPRICSRTSLRSSSRTARRDRTTLLRLRLSSITLHSRVSPELVQVVDPADVDQRSGQEAPHAEVQDQPALDDLDHDALDRLAGLGGRLDLAPCLLEPGALLRQQQAPLLVLLGQHQGVDPLAERDLLGRIHRAADRELVDRDDALRLVADVDQDLVLVDPHDLPADDVALLERLQRRVVVGDELPVDLDHQVCGGRR